MGSWTRREFLKTGLAGAAGLPLMLSTSWAQTAATTSLEGEDGYRLWLRYAPPPAPVAEAYRSRVRRLVIQDPSPTAEAIRNEMTMAIESMLGAPLEIANEVVDGAVVIGTAENSPLIRTLGWTTDLERAGAEGYVLRTATVDDKAVTVIASNGAVGALYGMFDLLRRMQTGSPIDALDSVETPALQLRLMNHWDNPNGSIERGYAGRSLWRWNELPDTLDPRYTDYARACASIGINGAVINNVNADPGILSTDTLKKVAALADVWRPYGVRVYVSVNFASPVRLGGLDTADPLNDAVKSWWRGKADEIYALIPDFGGFLVKANSEGQPGPKTYGRTHADGANMLAEAIEPHGGIIMWRAFVYDEDVDPDRAKRAYIEFTRLEGQFRPNVAIQVKNGPIDFQPREPFHPLFGGLPQTPVIAEIQATQEYTGQARHLVYLGPMWKEFLDADTHARGAGSTVANVLAGCVFPYRITGMVSVTNPGTDRNWCGHHFSQSNWYAFGRLAWDPTLTAEAIAEEWTRMTFTNDDAAVRTIVDMMMASHEIYTSYAMPLGLHHLIGGDHYAPQPWNGREPRPDWTATYYHQASKEGIGFDRTRRGNGAVDQYHKPVADFFDSRETCPDELLLWFHRLAWDDRLRSGETLWEALCRKYYTGARQAAELQETWASLAGVIDARRHAEVAERLAIQVEHAALWRDQVLEYFAGFSGMPIVRPE